MSREISNRENQVMNAFELQGIKDQLSSLLDNNPRKIEAFRTKIIKLSLDNALSNCSPESIIKCGIQALMLNLPIEAGQGYVVNYGGQAAFDCGYKGWQILAKRAGYSVLADVVYLCDEFSQEGFGFNRSMNFSPNFFERKGYDDKWAKDNLAGVIVSVLEHENDNQTYAFIDAGMINKIVAKSPSVQTEKARQYSPHEKWAEQMFAAKAIKQVLSKFAIDLSKTSQLNEAIQIVNSSESLVQQESTLSREYPQDKFDSNYSKWVDRVKTGKNPAMAIITHLSNSYDLSPEQLEKLFALRSHEPIEGEKVAANA